MSIYAEHSVTQSSAADLQTQNALNHVHTALPAKVLSFDAQKQTVTLQIQIKQILEAGESAISPLLDVPVHYPKGGGFCLTFPLQAGDEGLALFAERCIDGWWQNGAMSAPLDQRTFDFSDAFFIPGVSSLPKVIKPFFTQGLSLQTLDESVYFRLTAEGIFIKGNIEHQGNTTQQGDAHQYGNRTQIGNVEQQGDNALQGNLTATIISGTTVSGQSVSMGGISLANHTHGGVEPGGGNTGVAQ